MKMPKHWKKVKKSLNGAILKEWGNEEDERDVIYFSFDETLSLFLYHFLKEFNKNYSHQEDEENLEYVISFFEEYSKNVYKRHDKPGKKKKKKAFKKFCKVFERLWY